MRVRLIRRVTLMAVLLIAAGCGSPPPDERLSEMARQSLEQQARQNERLVDQNRQVAEAARELVEADARARQQIGELQRDMVRHDAQTRQDLNALAGQLHSELNRQRHSLDRQREELEHERRQIARQRQRDPVVAQAIGTAAWTLGALLPLLLAAYVLYAATRKADDPEPLCELLIDELAAEQPHLLPPDDCTTARLAHRGQPGPGPAGGEPDEIQ